MGSLEAMLEYGSRPLPFETACCEGFVEKNLNMHCFHRNHDIMAEEFTDVTAVQK